MADLETIVMAILRINDGKHFVLASEAPLPQSESELGFRTEADGLYCLRYEELTIVQKSFDLFYTNRLGLLGHRMEQQKQLKLQIEQ